MCTELYGLTNLTRNQIKMATKLYVGNLAETASEKGIRELFESFGQVNEVAVLRGFGFVVSFEF